MSNAVKIEKVDTVIIEVPTIRPHVLSMTAINRQVMTLVFIRFSDGGCGVGEAATIGGLSYGEESPEGVKLAIDTYCAPLLLGLEAPSPAAVMARLDRHVVGNHFAKNALETALLDAAARRADLPLSELLGGRLTQSVPVLWTLASGDTGRDVEEAEEMIASGRHNVFKLKIGKRALRADAEHVAAIKRALGARASLRVDVNQAWQETDALRGTQMLADAGADLIEQPLHRNNRAGMARLAARSPLPIMADESLRGPSDAFATARDAAAHVFSLKPAQAGGLSAAKKIAAIAEASHVGVYGGTMLEGAIGSVASAQLFATVPNMDWGTELFGPLLQTEDILTEPLEYRDHRLHLPRGPGLGVSLDFEKIEAFRRDGPSRTVFGPADGKVGSCCSS